eukprot:5708401-Pleurochrysis_carterae.AAC.1
MHAASTRSRQAPRAAHSTYDQTFLRWLQLSTYSSTSLRASISSSLSSAHPPPTSLAFASTASFTACTSSRFTIIAPLQVSAKLLPPHPRA